MTHSASQSGIANRRRGRRQERETGIISGGMYTLFAVELLLISIVLWAYLINRHGFPDSRGTIGQWGWGLVAGVVALWGTIFLAAARQTATRGNIDRSRNLLALAVGSGAILAGVLLIHAATASLGRPSDSGVRSQLSVPRGSTSAVVETAAPDAAKGRKWYGMSCVACHGRTGEGIANAAPSLRGSDFLRTADAAAIAALIRNGRAATDPANKSGKVMPAKGGNPFLDESKIADLVVFLQDLEAQMGPNLTGAESQLAEQPAVIVRNWTPQDLDGLKIEVSEESLSLGMQAFVKATCDKCHMAAVAGQELGPTLDQMALKYPRHELLKHIIEPSAEINENFLAHKFLLFDGRITNGVVVSESSEEIELLTDLLKPDQREVILVDDIDEMVKSKLSSMPEGLLDVLTKDEIAGLVAYVDTVGKQMAAALAPQLNRWVVPAANTQSSPSALAGETPLPISNWTDVLRQASNESYNTTFAGLFVSSTTVLALHFLWVAGTGAVVVLHRRFQLSGRGQLRVARQTNLLWMIGLIWLVVWYLLFFLFS